MRALSRSCVSVFVTRWFCQESALSLRPGRVGILWSDQTTGSFQFASHRTGDDPEVWSLLGYEGPSFEHGGYLRRGFDDLDWLPDPRVEEAS